MAPQPGDRFNFQPSFISEAEARAAANGISQETLSHRESASTASPGMQSLTGRFSLERAVFEAEKVKWMKNTWRESWI